MRIFLTTSFLFCVICFGKAQVYIQEFKANSMGYSLGSPMSYGVKYYENIFNEERYQTLRVDFESLEFSEDWINDLNTLPRVQLLNIIEVFGCNDPIANSIPKFSDLEHIRFLSLSRSLDVDHQELWNEVASMPNLEFLAIGGASPRNKHRINLQGIEVILKKIKGHNIKYDPSLDLDSLLDLTSLDYSCHPDYLDEGMKTLSTYLNLESLKISSRNLTQNTIPYLSKLKKLKRLDISCYEEFDIDLLLMTLKQLDSLKILKLIGIKNELPRSIGLLQQLDSLELSFSYKNKSVLPDEFYDLKNLKKLVHPLMDTLSPKIGQLGKLESLTLTGKFKQIPDEFGKLKKLKYLRISNDSLKHIPKCIGELTSLEELVAYYNKIETLPENIGFLKNLKTLELNGILLTKLPASFVNLNNLQVLNLWANDIKYLPSNIGGLKSLRTLNLQENFISIIPEEIGKLQQLEILNLSNNNISTVPSTIGNLENLKILKLQNNQHLSTTKHDNSRVERSKNDLKSIPPELAELKNISEIDFSRNPKLGDEAFEIIIKSNSKYKSVLLNRCGITKITKQNIGNFNCEFLDLSNNEILNLPSELFLNQSLSKLYVNSEKLEVPKSNYKNKTQIKLLAYELGFLSWQEIKDRPDIVDELMNMCKGYYSNHKKNPVLRYYPLAFSIDSMKAKSLLNTESYAHALYANGRYEECIPFYTQCLDIALSRGVRFVNDIASQMYARSDAYLKTADTLNYLKDLKYLANEFNYNTGAEIAVMSMLIKTESDNIDYILKAINKYNGEILRRKNRKDKTHDDLYKLSKLELLLISEKYEKFDIYAAMIYGEMLFNRQSKTILDYLILAKEICTNDWSDEKITDFKVATKSVNLENWSCGLIENWRKTKNPEISLKLDDLNQLICPN